MQLTAGTNRDAMRPHNLGAILRYVHRDGVLSRAALTARMGLTRASIGELLAELEALGAVTMVPGSRPRARAGRPSPRVTPDTARIQVLAAEIGADHIRALAVGLGGRILSRAACSTPKSHEPDAIVEALVTLCERVTMDIDEDVAVLGLGIGVAGVVRLDGHIELASSLGWTDLEFAERVQRALPDDVRVAVGNDADLGALAEHVRGVGVGVDHLVYVGVDDPGVGGGIIIDRQVFRGAGGYAGEFGHMTVNPAGRLCRCGNVGCWETEIGTERIAEALGLEASDTDSVAAELAKATECPHGLREAGRFLGLGLASIVNALNVQVVVLGGTLRDLYPVVRAEADAAFEQAVLLAPGGDVRLALSQLGADAASVGAAEMVFEALFHDPAAIISAAHRGPVLRSPEEPRLREGASLPGIAH